MRISNPIQGGRIRIRNYEATDLDFVTGMWFDEENGKYLSDPTRDFVDEAFQRALDELPDSKLGYYFVIEHADTGNESAPPAPSRTRPAGPTTSATASRRPTGTEATARKPSPCCSNGSGRWGPAQ